VLRRTVLGLIDLYRKGISPFTPASCRFVPTCSSYAHEAIDRYGVLRGGWIFLRRFVRCHPFGGHGFDPVPLLPGPAAAPRTRTSTAPPEGPTRP
jgi:uncharacterized protein